MNISWPGIVLIFLLGLAAGAVLAFFKARQLQDMPVYLGVGVGGFLLGQGMAFFLPSHPLRVGVVDIPAGMFGVVVVGLSLSLARSFSSRGARRPGRRY